MLIRVFVKLLLATWLLLALASAAYALTGVGQMDGSRVSAAPPHELIHVGEVSEVVL
jgi:hypothetical protein